MLPSTLINHKISQIRTDGSFSWQGTAGIIVALKEKLDQLGWMQKSALLIRPIQLAVIARNRG